MRGRVRRFVLGVMFSAALCPAAGTSLPPNELKPVPEVVAAEMTWDGPQIVRADRAGNVFFLRADTLQVYPLTQGGKLGEPRPLEVTGELPQLVRNAALSPGGDVWILSVDLSLRRFVDGKEKAVPPLDWRISGIGFARDEPIVSFLPLPVAWDQVYRERKGQIPRLMSFDGDRWNVLAEFPGSSAADPVQRRPDLNGAMAQHAGFIASDSQGRVWIARQYAYDVEQMGPSGRSRLHLVVGGGKVKERAGDGNSNGHAVAGLTAFRGQPAILDLVEGRDRRMYFLTAGGDSGGLALDRYDPVTSQLERIPLAFQLSGRATLAAGKKGLYIAAWNGRGGRWMLRWDSLEVASWTPVATAEISPALSAEGPSR